MATGKITNYLVLLTALSTLAVVSGCGGGRNKDRPKAQTTAEPAPSTETESTEADSTKTNGKEETEEDQTQGKEPTTEPPADGVTAAQEEEKRLGEAVDSTRTGASPQQDAGEQQEEAQAEAGQEPTQAEERQQQAALPDGGKAEDNLRKAIEAIKVSPRQSEEEAM